MERALSDDDIPTVPAFPVPGVREGGADFSRRRCRDHAGRW